MVTSMNRVVGEEGICPVCKRPQIMTLDGKVRIHDAVAATGRHCDGSKREPAGTVTP